MTDKTNLDELARLLADPQAVYLNMLRGGIAKPSPANIWHIYRKELLDVMPDEYRGEVEALRGEVARMREALSNALAMIGHKMPMSATALVAGETLVAGEVWKAGCAALAPRAALGEDGK